MYCFVNPSLVVACAKLSGELLINNRHRNGGRKDEIMAKEDDVVPSLKKQTKNSGKKTNEKNDKYDIKLL